MSQNIVGQLLQLSDLIYPCWSKSNSVMTSYRHGDVTFSRIYLFIKMKGIADRMIYMYTLFFYWIILQTKYLKASAVHCFLCCAKFCISLFKVTKGPWILTDLSSVIMVFLKQRIYLLLYCTRTWLVDLSVKQEQLHINKLLPIWWPPMDMERAKVSISLS